MIEKNEKECLEEWFEKISFAEKYYQQYHNLIDESRNFYKDSKKSKVGHYNIFWSTIETLKPFLYFKQPHFYVERQNKSNDKIERMACIILEKALQWNISQFDFESVIKYARNDFLISGSGILWEQYKPEFEEVKNPINPSENILIKKEEKVETVYVDPKDFLTDCKASGVWEEVEWVARKIYMDVEDIKNNFEVEDITVKGTMCIYEIWDKKSGKVFWISKAYPFHFLKISNDVINIQNFFPCPKPIWSTQTNDSIIPVPDYSLIKEMLNELNGINARMKLTMQALKISGAYDNSFPELANILSKDVTLVSVTDFSKLRESGGIRGIIDFVPLEQYITALEQLARRRQDVINGIFDITGVSDIMRGNSNANETATAIVKKTNFGTLRNQDRQNEMQRFIRDLLRIKAEIICEYFSKDKLVSFLPKEMREDNSLIDEAINLLKTEKLRGMIFSVETGNVLNQSEENSAVLSAIQCIGKMIQEALLTVSQQKHLLPLYRSMMQAVITTMPKARCFETVIENVFNNIEKELFAPPLPPQPDKVAEMEQQKNLLKEKELMLKAKNNADKLALAEKELQLKTAIKLAE